MEEKIERENTSERAMAERERRRERARKRGDLEAMVNG